MVSDCVDGKLAWVWLCAAWMVAGGVGCSDNGTGGGGSSGMPDVRDVSEDTTMEADTTQDVAPARCDSLEPACPSGRWCDTSVGTCQSCPVGQLTCADLEAGDSSIDTERNSVTVAFAAGSTHIDSITAEATIEGDSGGIGGGGGSLTVERTVRDDATTGTINFEVNQTGEVTLQSVTVTDACGNSHQVDVSATWSSGGDVSSAISCGGS